MSTSCLHLVVFAVLTIIGGVLFIVGFSTDVWLVWNGGSSGLWRLCASNVCTRFSDWPQLADWMQAVQAMLIISLIFIVAYCVFAIIGKALNKRHCVALAVAFGVLAGVLAMTSYILFAYKSQHPHQVTNQLSIGWSFYLASVGTLILLIATLFLALVCARSSYEPLEGDMKKGQGYKGHQGQGHVDTEKMGGNY